MPSGSAGGCFSHYAVIGRHNDFNPHYFRPYHLSKKFSKHLLSQKPIWDAMSSQYANGAEGIATYAHPDGYVGKVWSNIEKPILEENDIIIQEVIIDAK